MLQISLRPATAEEQIEIINQTRQGILTYGCMIVFLGGLGVGVGGIGHWVGSFISEEASTIGLWVGLGFGALMLACIIISFIPYERRTHKAAVKDAEEQLVQEVVVSACRVIEIAMTGNCEMLALDTGVDQILFLQGQWLLDPKTYGAEEVAAELVDEKEELYVDEYWNALPPPYSFPSTEFTVTRLPNSGVVLGIRVTGTYFAPEKIVDAMKPEYEFNDSELFAGELDSIKEVLEREHATKFIQSSG
jgi:hypothetical protein